MLCRITLGGRVGAIIESGRAIIEKIAGGGKKSTFICMCLC